MNNINSNTKLCTGCTACVYVCPKNCIEMKPNEEGFSYPVIDDQLCIHCGKCLKTCPLTTPPEKNSVNKGYVVRNKDMQVVGDSTSGGAFSAIAEYVLEQDGIVYGAGYDENMKVRHFCIDASQKKRLAEMRGSKYVQSDLKNNFEDIKASLLKGRLVLFSGTPCQVAGLKAFLAKDYDNLITVDLVCHGVASPLIFEQYMEYQQKKNRSRAVNMKFRNKTYGYHSGTMMISFENGHKYYGSGRIDYMLKAYFNGSCSRNACYECPFKGMERCSDFTIFDSWNIGKLVPGLKDDDKGYTNVYVYTEKGRKVLEEMSSFLDFWEADADQMKELDGIMIEHNPERDIHRSELIKECVDKGFESTMQKYLPVSFVDHILEKTKGILYKCGLLRLIKK